MEMPVSGENKRKHLEFIQAVIGRMAGNLFFLKGWAITLIAGLFALAAKDANSKYFALAFGVAVVLWMVDGYFLRLERLFRSLYDHVRMLNEREIDFSLNPHPFAEAPKNKWYRCVFSVSLVIFYLPLLVLMALVMIFLTH